MWVDYLLERLECIHGLKELFDFVWLSLTFHLSSGAGVCNPCLSNFWLSSQLSTLTKCFPTRVEHHKWDKMFHGTLISYQICCKIISLTIKQDFTLIWDWNVNNIRIWRRMFPKVSSVKSELTFIISSSLSRLLRAIGAWAGIEVIFLSVSIMRWDGGDGAVEINHYLGCVGQRIWYCDKDMIPIYCTLSSQ